jgi:lipopolysaccharide transport protein LptA
MRGRTAVRWRLAAVLAVAAAAVWAQEAPEGTNSTVITSRKLTYDYRNRYATFEGDVVVTDPGVRMEADRMTVLFNTEGAPDKVVAVGNVRIEQADKRAVCGRAVYQVTLGRLDLSEKPVVRRGQDILRGKTITFWRNEDRMEGSDVRMVIYQGGEGALRMFSGSATNGPVR